MTRKTSPEIPAASGMVPGAGTPAAGGVHWQAPPGPGDLRILLQFAGLIAAAYAVVLGYVALCAVIATHDHAPTAEAAPPVILGLPAARPAGDGVDTSYGLSHRDLRDGDPPKPRPTSTSLSGGVYAEALSLIHWRESRCGEDPACRPGIVGPAGEQGEYQVTPIWCADVERLTGQTVDPYNTDRLRPQIRAWLAYYGPRVGARSPDQLAALYRYGPGGYRRAHGIGPCLPAGGKTGDNTDRTVVVRTAAVHSGGQR